MVIGLRKEEEERRSNWKRIGGRGLQDLWEGGRSKKGGEKEWRGNKEMGERRRVDVSTIAADVNLMNHPPSRTQYL